MNHRGYCYALPTIMKTEVHASNMISLKKNKVNFVYIIRIIAAASSLPPRMFNSNSLYFVR